jgi:transmembrane sensor
VPALTLSRRAPGQARLRQAVLVAGIAAAVLGAWAWGRAHHSHSDVTAFETRPGEQGRLTLPDGSNVLLAPGGRLSFVSDFGEHDRVVELAGEALFEVLPQVERPFRVGTRRALVTVTGTQFVVRALPDDAVDRVVVRSGEVRLAGRGDPAGELTVATGQEGRVPPSGAPWVGSADTVAAFAWVTGGWALRDTPLAEVAAEMSRRYGAPVVAHPRVAGLRVTGDFHRESRAELLEVLALATSTALSRSGDTIRFVPNATVP